MKYLSRLQHYFFSVFTAIFFSIFFGLSSQSAFAAISFTISNPQTQGDEITIDVSISGLTSSVSCPNNICYLQGGFVGSNGRYFGITKNNSGTEYSYISSPDPSNMQTTFFSFNPDSGNWSGKVIVKPDFTSPNFNGSSNYDFKMWRYSGESKNSAGDSDNTLSIQLIGPTATLTLAPTNTPTPTSKPTSTPIPTPANKPAATSTPIPTNKPASNAVSPTSTSIPTSKITPASNAANATPTKILPTSKNSPTLTSKVSPTNNPKLQNKTEVLGVSTSRSPFAFIFIIIGSLFFLVCGILAFLKYEEGKDKKSSE